MPPMAPWPFHAVFYCDQWIKGLNSLRVWKAETIPGKIKHASSLRISVKLELFQFIEN